MQVSVNRIGKQGEELYDDSNKIQVDEESENDVKDFGNEIVEVDDEELENDDKDVGNKIVEVDDEELENDDKDIGNKIVEVDDTDMEDTRGLAQGSSESIESTLEEMNEEEINLHNNNEEINVNLAEIVDDGKDIDQHNDGKEITIITGNNMMKRKLDDDEDSVKERSKNMNEKQFFPTSKDDLIQLNLDNASEEIYARVLNRSKANGKQAGAELCQAQHSLS